ncbi:hypothetical protein FIBSPDRAFT_533069 [Athelia psychrophila]|uniref:Secreted protein n=1 Tax=Athelia psychrophila TaxID=1759441 RepID=A0A166JA95_9AGAM|nr:hypothetical protein FIBSPDRAFT_533069 [Fibularhizoctonia sp. CBS 109695]
MKPLFSIALWLYSSGCGACDRRTRRSVGHELRSFFRKEEMKWLITSSVKNPPKYFISMLRISILAGRRMMQSRTCSAKWLGE